MREEKHNKLSGYPSIDKPWLKYYEEGVAEKSEENITGKTVWDVIEERLHIYRDIPAITYYNRTISRREFCDSVNSWVKGLTSLGVKENDVVFVYSPFVPVIGSILFAINQLGACSQFMKLDVPSSMMQSEIQNSKYAVVLVEALSDDILQVLNQPQFKKVILVSVSYDMAFLSKNIFKVKNLFSKRKQKSMTKESKFVSPEFVLSLGNKVNDEQINLPKLSMVGQHPAFITYSSGTSGGILKGTIVSNEAAIVQLQQSYYSGVNYRAGKKALVNLPPTASTSLECAFLLALYTGMTLDMQPVFLADKLYDQIIKSKAQVIIATGSLWRGFFETNREKGCNKDLSFIDVPIVGGEGITTDDFYQMNNVLKMQNCKTPMINGYGLSEMFSVIACDKPELAERKSNKPVNSVGIPLPAITIGAYDDAGRELPYNTRGELWVKGKTRMIGYYNNPELTSKCFEGEWLKTGDICEIDEDGRLYIYGRKSRYKVGKDGALIYLFDLENDIRSLSNGEIRYCVVFATEKYVAHVVCKDEAISKEKIDEIKRKICDKYCILYQDFCFKMHKRLEANPMTGKIDYQKLEYDENIVG